MYSAKTILPKAVNKKLIKLHCNASEIEIEKKKTKRRFVMIF